MPRPVGNGTPALADAAFPLQHPEIASVLWSIILTLVLAPLAMAALWRRSRD